MRNNSPHSVLLNLLLIITLVIGSSASSANTVSKKSLIPSVQFLRGNFEQVKHVKGFEKPLISKGGFVISAAKGVLWDTSTPYPSMLTILPNGTVRNELDSKRSSKRTTASSSISRLTAALIAGDNKTLEAQFDISSSGNESAWQTLLKPRRAPMSQSLAKIELSGGKYVEQIIIYEKNGNRTELRFSELTEQSGQLSSAEIKRLQ